MGNRALRREAGKLLKGSGKLYYGKKLSAYKALPARSLREIINNLQYNVGDLIHDCDGFNHEIVSMTLSTLHPYRSRNVEVVGRHYEVLMDHDTYRCECSQIEPPRSREEIERYKKRFIEFHGESEGRADSPYYQELHRRLEAGEHITDKDGKLLPDMWELKSPKRMVLSTAFCTENKEYE